MATFILTNKQFTQGRQVQRFEESFSTWIGAKHSLYVSSGSTANLLLVASVMEKYGLGRGDKVLLPVTTWVTNINPIFQLGLTPVFCDVNLDNYSFDVSQMERIAVEHPDIKMVFVTHLLGIPAPVDTYKKILPNAIFIEDVCEAQGASGSDDIKIGANSVGATFSFYFGHHMSTVEGGMITTNDTDLYEIMKMKRSHGLSRVSSNPDRHAKEHPEIDPQFLFVTDGYNFRNTELGAVLGQCQLKRIDDTINIRRARYDEYWSIMNNNNDLLYTPEYSKNNSCFCFPLITRKKTTKSKLIDLLAEHKIEYRPIVGGNLLRQPYMKKYSSIDTTNADILHENGIYIGCNQFVTSTHMSILSNVIDALST
jgi:CDP-6-deoxy-D-xylo-4-hexulose-3-dehydrase